MDESQLRVSDSEREDARAALADHMAAGRITMEEYDERSQAVLSARTRADLEQQFHDLPARAVARRPAAPVERRRPSLPERLAAGSGSLSLVVFFVLGFAFNAWAWCWIVFLLPGVFAGWWGYDKRERRG